jgi:hypothetical protein
MIINVLSRFNADAIVSSLCCGKGGLNETKV